jgi:transposase
MHDRSATALVGLDGFVVLSQAEESGEHWLLVETTRDLVGCPGCGVRATGHGRSVVMVRDLPISGKPVRLVWRRRRWRCCDPDCEVKTFTEEPSEIEGMLSSRAAFEICRLVGQDGRSVAEVARMFGVSWHSAMAAVRRHGRPMIDDPRRLYGVRALGVDEHKMLAPGPKHYSVFCTQLVDLDRSRLLDVVPHRSAASVTTWLDARTGYFRRHVAVAAIDPHAGYARAIRTSLPHATITVDPFHLVKLANSAIDDVRRRVQRDVEGHRGRKDDPLYGIRRLVTRGWERLSERQIDKVLVAMRRGDPYDEVGAAVVAKEVLRQMYTAGSAAEAREDLAEFYAVIKRAEVKELDRLARTVKRWEPQILSFFTTGHTNAKSEAMNLITEKLRRVAHGMRNFENYRLRLLLHSGVEWKTVPTARIRDRHPRHVA